MTYEEKVAMYMKLTKKELISMLIENQRMVEIFTPVIEDRACPIFRLADNVTAGDCVNCGKPSWEHR